MKKRKHLRITAALLALTMLLTTAPVFAYGSANLLPQKRAASAAFADTKGTWCDAAVQTCYEAGLIDGKSAARYAPTDSLTYAQITVICARFRSLLTGGTGTFSAPASGEAWYAPYLKDLIAALSTLEYYPAFLDADAFAQYANTPCSREDFVNVVASVLASGNVTMTTLNHLTTVPDSNDATVLAFYNAGILTGSDAYGTFHAGGILNRGQAAAILARVVDPSQRKTLSLQSFDLCRDVFGIAPETVVLTAGSTSLTMEQFSYYLAFYLLSEYQNGVLNGAAYNQPAEAMSLAIGEMKSDLAVDQLAKAKSVTPSSAADVIADYNVTDGMLGITQTGWVWYYSHLSLYYQLLLKYNINPDDSDTSALDAALTPLKSALTVTQSAALSGLNLKAVQARLAASPYNG